MSGRLNRLWKRLRDRLFGRHPRRRDAGRRDDVARLRGSGHRTLDSRWARRRERLHRALAHRRRIERSARHRPLGRQLTLLGNQDARAALWADAFLPGQEPLHVELLVAGCTKKSNTHFAVPGTRRSRKCWQGVSLKSTLASNQRIQTRIKPRMAESSFRRLGRFPCGSQAKRAVVLNCLSERNTATQPGRLFLYLHYTKTNPTVKQRVHDASRYSTNTKTATSRNGSPAAHRMGSRRIIPAEGFPLPSPYLRMTRVMLFGPRAGKCQERPRTNEIDS